LINLDKEYYAIATTIRGISQIINRNRVKAKAS
jgi:hypothetical protein